MSAGGKKGGRAGQVLIKSFARIKPISADKDGGVVAAKGLKGFDADAGVVEIGSEHTIEDELPTPPVLLLFSFSTSLSQSLP